MGKPISDEVRIGSVNIRVGKLPNPPFLEPSVK